MKVSITPEVIAALPELRLGILLVRDLRNDGHAEELPAMQRQEEARIRRDLSLEGLAGHPRILPWREAYRAFGAKPKEHRSSVENLYRLVLRGVDVRAVNPLVDIYNFVCLRFMVPVGGEDLDRVEGDIELAVAGEHEAPVKLLGDEVERPPHRGEVIYRDSVSAICRRLNWREADRTKLAASTRSAILVVEALPPITVEEIRGALAEISRLTAEHCGGEFTSAILDASEPRFEG